MEAYDITNLLKELEKNPHIFICGPSYGNTQKSPKTKLRVYAHGSVLCELPTTQKAAITLFDENYLKDEPSLRDSFNGLQNKEATEKFLRNHRDKLVDIMGRRFTSKDESLEERNQQTIIARAHTDFSRHDGTVVCDFQFAVPREYGCEGKKLSIFDLVTFSKDETGGVFTLVEYKCNENACTNLGKHADDMLHCMTDSTASDWCKRELLRRLGYMREYGLLQNCPDELEHLRPEDMKLRAAFLFTSGVGLEGREKAAELCEYHIRKDIRDTFFYCFEESPDKADLSKMVRWNKFKGG